MNSRYAFCVTTWSGPKLVETIHHIKKGERVLVVDGSQYGWPLSKQWNYGIERLCREGYESVIVCNDDIVLREDTADLLAWAFLEGQHEGKVGWTDKELLLISARHGSIHGVCTDEVDWDEFQTRKPEFQPGPDFSCYITNTRLFEVVGRFDEGFIPCYHEDNDMHRRIQLAGCEAGAYAPYWHYGSATYRHDPERKMMVDNGGFRQSREHYIAKHGGPPGQETFPYPYNDPSRSWKM